MGASGDRLTSIAVLPIADELRVVGNNAQLMFVSEET